MSETLYKPGVCNIGKNEIRKRYFWAVIGFILAVVVGIFLVEFNIYMPVSLSVLFFPFLLGFEGLFQARWKFCAGFASNRKFNFSGTADQVGKVEDDLDHHKDMLTAMKIHAYSVFLSLLFTAIVIGVYYGPYLLIPTPTVSVRMLF